MKSQVIAYYPMGIDVVVNIYEVIHDADDKIKFAWDICGKVKKPCYSKIRNDKEGRSYFNSYNHKIYLDECLLIR